MRAVSSAQSRKHSDDLSELEEEHKEREYLVEEVAEHLMRVDVPTRRMAYDTRSPLETTGEMQQ